MSYPLFIDTNENFSASIKIEGASVSASKARLLVQTEDFNIMFDGTIIDDVVSIPLTKLKSMLKEGSVGTMKLEIVADDTLLTPWESTYEAKLYKKALVSDMEKVQVIDTTPKITVNVAGTEKDIVTEFCLILSENQISIENINKKTIELKQLTNKFIEDNNELNIDKKEFIDKIINKLINK